MALKLIVAFLLFICTISQKPSLVFFCELQDSSIAEYYNNATLLSYLIGLNATVAVATSNLSLPRAHAIEQLNKANVSVTLWIVTPWDEGYWENMDNYHYVAYQRYQEIQEWIKQYSLNVDGFGLDLEIDGRFLTDWDSRNFSAIYQREISRNISDLYNAKRVYQNLSYQIKLDGYDFVETYVLPLIYDEREVNTTIFERATAITDIGNDFVDYEVPMLYSSSFPFGKGVLYNYSYTKGIGGIGLGITNIGVGNNNLKLGPYKNWNQFYNDLIFSVHTPYGNNRLYVYALEGCFNEQRNWLDNMLHIDWHKSLDPTVELEYKEEGEVVSKFRVEFQKDLMKWDHL